MASNFSAANDLYGFSGLSLLPRIGNDAPYSTSTTSHYEFEEFLSNQAPLSKTQFIYGPKQGLKPMSDNPTREEMNAKLEAVEARLDAKLSGISGDIRALSTNVSAMNASLSAARTEFSDVRKDVIEQNRATRLTVIITAIGLVVAIVAAVWQMQGGLLTAFQTGLTANQIITQPNTQPTKPQQ